MNNTIKYLLFLFITCYATFAQAQYQDLPIDPTPSPTIDLTPGLLTTNSYDNLSTDYFNKTLTTANQKHPLVKTGKILTATGVPLLILGIVMVSGAESLSYQCTNGDCEGDPRGGFGILALTGGLGLTGTGITLWVIGNNKSK